MVIDKTPWLKIKARFESGKPVPAVARSMAEEVLGERFVRAGKGRRPDARDLAAGDDIFRDEGMVL